MTIVGDFGQASRPAALSSWDEVLAQLPDRAGHRVVNLTVNYRTPAEIMEVAHGVLVAAAPGVEPTRAVRRTGEPPEFVAVGADRLLDEVVQAARDAADAPGTLAVVAPFSMHEALVEQLADLGALAGSADALDAPIAVLAAEEAKGLEFDQVIVVEPARLVAPGASGLRLLYVTLTRATQRLVVVHAEPLPEPLRIGRASGVVIAAS
jgi:DNA helicase IV